MFREGKKYYLKRMRYGQITDKEVAKIFNTSVGNVQHAFVEYSNKKNPFRERKLFASIISIAEIIISIVSILLVYFTLVEMQVARNNSYLPDIHFSKTSFAITWNMPEQSDSNELMDNMFQQLCSTTEYIDTVPQIELINIGMGTAKNIHMEWAHSDNMRALSSYLYEVNPEPSFAYKIEKSYIYIS